MKEIALHILDIIQNSIRAEATEIRISIVESLSQNRFILNVKDNGKGIPPEILEKISDPFVTTRKTRKTGLGLSLLKQHAEMTGGNLSISSVLGSGTEVEAIFIKDHIDKQPSGDLPGIFRLMLASNPEINIIYYHKTDFGEFSISSSEIKNILGLDNFNDFQLLNEINSLVKVNLEEIKAEL